MASGVQLLRHGETFLFRCRSEFIGESLNGKPHGLGTIMYSREPPDPEGRVEYAGTFRGGQRHGGDYAICLNAWYAMSDVLT
eukprot:680359-Rhodomonas_salina.2